MFRVENRGRVRLTALLCERLQPLSYMNTVVSLGAYCG